MKAALLFAVIGIGGFLFIGGIAFSLLWIIIRKYGKRMGQFLFGYMLGPILRDAYHENLAELINALKRTPFQTIVELSLRAEKGEIIKRPLGSPKRFNHFDGLMFIPAQMAVLPLEREVQVDVRAVLGPKAARPLYLDNPLIIGGMGFGVSLSEKSRLALAKGAKLANVALNSGEGPFLPEERQEAGQYIWQIGHGQWGRNKQAMDAANMLEIHVGQGARLGAYQYKPNSIKGKAQKLMGVSPVGSMTIPARMPGISSSQDWIKYVADLRCEGEGKPIGIKLMASGSLEKELEIALKAGVDVINIDGAQGGSGGSSPNLQDNFGLPTLQGLMKAQNFLIRQGVRQNVSLIIGGGFYTPGECLKAFALGADAVSLGTVPLYALTHNQMEKVMPWEPLTQLVFYDSPYKDKLNVELAAKSISNVLTAMIEEIKEGARAMGKGSLRELSSADMVALDEWTAKVTGVNYVL